MAQEPTAPKPWYKSKIALLGIALAFVGGSDLLLHWLSGNLSLDQIQGVQTAYPELADGLKRAVEGKNYFGIVTTVAGFLTAIWRVWFTSAPVAPPL